MTMYVTAATCETLEKVRIRLQTHSWAVMNNMTTSMLFPESCRPCQEQGDYILQTNEDNKVVLFEGAVYSDTSSVINLETKKMNREVTVATNCSGQLARKFASQFS